MPCDNSGAGQLLPRGGTEGEKMDWSMVVSSSRPRIPLTITCAGCSDSSVNGGVIPEKKWSWSVSAHLKLPGIAESRITPCSLAPVTWTFCVGRISYDICSYNSRVIAKWGGCL